MTTSPRPPAPRSPLTFATLPLEIRLRIWSHTTLHPQTITLKTITTRPLESHLVSTQPPRPALLTNRESRTLAQSLLSKAFLTHRPGRHVEEYTYVNFESDTVSILDEDLTDLVWEDKVRVRHLRVEVGDTYHFVWVVVGTEVLAMEALESVGICVRADAIHYYAGEGETEEDVMLELVGDMFADAAAWKGRRLPGLSWVVDSYQDGLKEGGLYASHCVTGYQ